MSYGSTKKFYSIINQNYLEPETDRNLDLEIRT